MERKKKKVSVRANIKAEEGKREITARREIKTESENQTGKGGEATGGNVQMSPAVWRRLNTDEVRRTSGTLRVSLTHMCTHSHTNTHMSESTMSPDLSAMLPAPRSYSSHTGTLLRVMTKGCTSHTLIYI